MTTPTIVAEIGGNHRGEMSTALRMIEIVGRYCREHFQLDGSVSDVVVKFQKRTPHLTPSDYERPHPNPYHAYGDSYGLHREALEFHREQHAELAEKCQAEGVGYACSAWDVPALEDIVQVPGLRWVKIPSARNLNIQLMERALSLFDGPLHVSVGMTTRAEVRGMVNKLVRMGVSQRVVLYACTSGYPVAAEDVRLGEIGWLQDEFGGMVQSIGFSGHHHGISIDMAAAAMGVSHIERHFTLNRTWKGTDHAASLEPDGFRKLVRDAAQVTKAMGMKDAGLLPVEEPMRAKLRDVA